MQRFEEDWLRKSGGFWRAFKPYFLTKEVGVHQMDVNWRSLQMIQIREHERNVVIQQFGMPPELLGVLESSNRATIGAADYLFSRYVVQPRLEMWRGVLQDKLVPEFDERLILDYVSPVRADETLQLQAATAAPHTLTVDEWRALQGQTPLDDDKGTVHIFSAGLTEHVMGEEPDPVVPLVPAPGSAPPPMPGEMPGDDEDHEPDEDEQDDGGEAAYRHERKAWRSALADDLAVLPEPESETHLKALADDPADLPEPSREAARFEPSLARALVRLWSENASLASLEALEGQLGRGDEDGVVATVTGIENRGLVVLVEPTLRRVFRRGAQVGARPLRALGVQVRGPVSALDLEATNPAAVQWARTHAGALVLGSAEVRERVRQLIVRSQEQQIDVRQLARLIRDQVGLTPRQSQAVIAFRARLVEEGVEAEALMRRVTRYADAQRRMRALTIARTETIGALNQGQQELWRVAVRDGHIRPDLMQRVWITTPDERLEFQCEALEGKHVEIDEEFAPGVMAPPLHPNCRCAVGLARTQ